MDTAQKNQRSHKAFQNRELSWFQFNRRVQMEADRTRHPLLERAKFLAIVTSNLDEFVQVRYGKVLDKAKNAPDKKVLGGITAESLRRKVNKEILRQNNSQYLLYEGIRSELYLHGVRLYPVFTMTEEQRARELSLFENDIMPFVKVLPQDAEPAQKQLHLCAKLTRNGRGKSRFALVALPASLPRLYELSSDEENRYLIRLEEIVKHHLEKLFPKEKVDHVAAFRILRNQNFLLDECTMETMPAAVRQMLTKRRTGDVVRLEAEERMSEEMLGMLTQRFRIKQEQRYRATGPLDLNKLMMGLYGMVKRPDLKFESHEPVVLDELMGDDVFDRIVQRDYLMYHPYHSFAPVVHLLRKAAEDPAVRSIQMTLYRVSSNSPIVAALADAAAAGKDVFVMMEACARFDEDNNLFWGERLSRAGCKVCYGFPGVKTHSKIVLIEREVNGEMQRFAHLGTGNYHDGTAKLYTDFGLLTADQVLTADAVSFFERLRGSEDAPMQELIKAPEMLQPTVLSLIQREKENAMAGLPSGIIAKMNSLSDVKVMEALCEAGRSGVKVQLIVRGICCLIPGVTGVSDNVEVYSLVGRNLEHPRAFRFENAGQPEIYLSSADWMPRNLYRRVELMFPVKDESCKRAVENVLRLQLGDNLQLRMRLPDGSYALLEEEEQPGVDAQDLMLRDIAAVFEGTALGGKAEEA
ncbi:MAG: polyphosphate kinase 1 [Clostridiales bacterium]|nr:polyphosphate kinase 1 [Clostridiales bacterium]